MILIDAEVSHSSRDLHQLFLPLSIHSKLSLILGKSTIFVGEEFVCCDRNDIYLVLVYLVPWRLATQVSFGIEAQVREKVSLATAMVYFVLFYRVCPPY